MIGRLRIYFQHDETGSTTERDVDIKQGATLPILGERWFIYKTELLPIDNSTFTN
jgi:hypothetical protein